jgi:hypothetical protein
VETPDTRSIPELFSAVTGDLANLVRKESELIRAEVSEKLADAGKAAAQMSVGAALLLGGFLTLMAAIVIGLSKFMDPFWAALLVGVVAGLVGFSLVKSASKKVSPAEMMPDRSTRQFQKDAQMVKEQMR